MIITGNKIRFLSASDRINYGDLLFPIIFKKFIDDNNLDVKFENYGIVKSDLSSFGAFKTKSFKQLEKDVCENDKIVIGGGEVLFASWKTLYAFISPTYRKLIKNDIIFKIDRKIQFPNRLLSSNKVKIPFCFSSTDFNLKSLKIYYSSVGGGTKIKKNELGEHILKSINKSRLFSLRDKRSMSYFDNVKSIDNILVPDTALIMSKYFDSTFLSKNKTIDDIDFSYFFVQIGINKGPTKLKSFVSKLQRISNVHKTKILLCPIGLAPGHEDHYVLKELKSYDDRFVYIHPKNIFDIMYLISKAKMYLGTSLHGAITAMSYDVPFIGLNKKISKLESYAKTWINENYINVNFEELNENTVKYYTELFMTNYSRVKFINQTKLIKDNLNFIIHD